jgi:hypothetical protein
MTSNRWFFCTVCAKGYHVWGDSTETKRLLREDNYPCVTPLCSGRLRGAVPHSHYQLRFKDVPVQDFYRSVHGLGGVSAPPATLSRTSQLLREKRIVLVDGEQVGSPARTIIRRLVLEDGTQLHFDFSSKGACLYYIEEPEMNNDPSDTVADAHSTGIEGLGSDGEEVG